MIGKGSGARPANLEEPPAAFCRCCHRGVRSPGRRRGISERPARRSRGSERRRARSRPARRRARSSISVGSSNELLGRRRRVGVGQVERDAVVGPERLRLDAERVAEPTPRAPAPTARARARRTASGRTRASRRSRRGSARRRSVRSDGTAPVALCCSSEEREQVLGGAARRASARSSAARAPSLGASATSSRRSAADLLARARTGGPAPSPFQNGILPGTPGRRRDEHAVARDLLDPPGRGAEQERLARAGLVDHLLVELADRGRRRRPGARRRGRGRESCPRS